MHFLNENTKITNLKVEYQYNPIGLDVDHPRFSWNMFSSQRGQKQTAYQILVASDMSLLNENQADIWNSNLVNSNQSVAVIYNGPPLSPSTRYYWKVLVWDKDHSILSSSTHSFETGLLSRDGIEGWSGAQWISMANKKPNSLGAPMFRKISKLSGKVKSAKLYISSLGVYTVHINGKRVGVENKDGDTSYELLTPGWTNYDETINYMTYDVTNYIKDNDSVAIGATIGNGWYNGRISVGSTYYSERGHNLALFAKLLIINEDGTTQIIVTDIHSGWKATDNGPIRENDIYDGENYDATKKMPGWDTVDFDDYKWSTVIENDYTKRFPNAKVISYPAVTARIIEQLTQYPKKITIYNGTVGENTSKNGRGQINIVKEIRTENTQSVPAIHLSSNETAIFDLFQNMVGVPNISLKGQTGTKIKLRFGEISNDDSEGADGPKGSVYFANLRSAKQTSIYTLKGNNSSESFQPSMTFYGFRYVEVTILTPDTSIEIQGLKGKVASSLTEQNGVLRTSSKEINQLFSNTIWGHRGNYFWIPTDCPQRDERLGWTGDTQLFARTALFNGNSNLFLENFMDILVDSQRIYGFDQASYTSTAPGHQHVNFNSFALEGKGPKGQSGWADIGVILPWTIWQMTGDVTIIKKHYDSIVTYMDWLYSITGESYKGPGGIGDWLGFQGTGNQFISDVYYAYDALLMTEMAKILQKEKDVERFTALFTNIKKSIIKRYISVDHGKKLLVKSSVIEDRGDIFEKGIFVYESIKEDNTQTALLWCLKLRLYENDNQKEQIKKLLMENIKNEESFKMKHPNSTRVNYAENTLSIGFLGVNIIAPVLSDHGMSDLSYALLLQDKMPSWLYSVKNGATTIWERWNSYSVENGFGNVGMNSFNHYSYGAIVEWMFQYMAGISNDPQVPGFKHFIMKPTIDPARRITNVDASFKSENGLIKSAWNIEGDTLIYQMTIPANTSATVTLPAKAVDAILENNNPINHSEGLKFISFEEGIVTLEAESGQYEFVSKL